MNLCIGLRYKETNCRSSKWLTIYLTRGATIRDSLYPLHHIITLATMATGNKSPWMEAKRIRTANQTRNTQLLQYRHNHIHIPTLRIRSPAYKCMNDLHRIPKWRLSIDIGRQAVKLVFIVVETVKVFYNINNWKCKSWQFIFITSIAIISSKLKSWYKSVTMSQYTNFLICYEFGFRSVRLYLLKNGSFQLQVSF